MKTTKDYVDIFNITLTNGISTNQVTSLIEDYLIDINSDKKYFKLISFIKNNPQLIQIALTKIVDHFCKKHNIFRLFSDNGNVLYYYV